MDPVFLPDHASHVFPVIIIDHGPGKGPYQAFSLLMGPNTVTLWFYFFGLKLNFWPPMAASYISPPLV